MTKQFTAVAVLQLVNKGALDLDRAISELLPAYGLDSRITVRMLLNQTSGLADYTSFSESASWTTGVAQPTVLTKIVQSPLLFSPGTAYSYSNSNYYILGSIIESVTGSSYADYLAANVLGPAQLSHTSYSQPLSSAAPYTPTWTDGPLWDPSFTFSAGALWSSALDLATWNGALMSDTLLPATLFTLSVTPPANVPVFGSSAPSQYGMGWLLTTQLGRPFVLHDGATGSYSAFNGMFLDDGFSIAIMTNIELPNGGTFEGTAMKIINGVCGTAALAGSC